MSRPYVAIIPSRDGLRISLSRKYLDALFDAGGIGVAVAYTDNPERIREYSDIFDGFLFSGGVDVAPELYGEQKNEDSVEIDGERDFFEKMLFEAAYEARKPMLAICRGIQALNVFLGGSLYQHIDGHMQEQSGETTTHRVRVLDGRLYEITGKRELWVNSFHHQCIKELSPRLVCDAISEDGYIECVHGRDYPFMLGIQWHPEFFYTLDESMRRIFAAFVSACRDNCVKVETTEIKNIDNKTKQGD